MATATLTPVEECYFSIAGCAPAKGSSWVPGWEDGDRAMPERNWGDLPRLYLQLFFPGLCGTRGLHALPSVRVVDPARRTISSWRREGSHVFTGAAETSDGSVSMTLDEIFGGMPEVESE